ncbi:MAG: hypothetical protein MR671_02745 [Clostridiales bacterium]|nr:hypothetical protein [Clostridiales bacterium]
MQRRMVSKSFIKGYGSVLNLFGRTKKNRERYAASFRDDQRAIKADWMHIGDDIWGAMKKYDGKEAIG